MSLCAPLQTENSVLDFHINSIIQYKHFCAWLLLLNSVFFFGFAHGISCMRVFSYFQLRNIPLYEYTMICSSVEHLGHFSLGHHESICKNIHVQLFGCIYIFISFGYLLTSTTIGSCGRCSLTLLETTQ